MEERKIYAESDLEEFIKKVEAKGEKFLWMFKKSCYNVTAYEEDYRRETHGNNPDLIISSINSNVYKAEPLNSFVEEHMKDCKSCQRFMRYHKIRKGLYNKLGVPL